MFLNEAHAADAAPNTTATTAVPPTDAAMPADAMMMNVAMVLVMAVLFYLLLIRPQQKRFKEHSNMINRLNKGTKVVTQGGLVGTIESSNNESEVVVDFGNNVKITMLRSYIIGPYDDANSKPANDDSKSKKDKSSK